MNLSKIVNSYRPQSTRIIFKQNVYFHNSPVRRQISRPVLKKEPGKFERLGSYGWFLLTLPAASFALGVWQIKRKFWKEQLISDLEERTSSEPVLLPKSMEEIQALEYKPVHVRGTFLHDKEVYIGPRGFVDKETDSSRANTSFFQDSSNQGYLVVTPLKLEDRDQIILVNRGWVEKKRAKPSSRQEGQVQGVVDVIGLLRVNEPRPTFSIKNQEGSKVFFYRDLEAMCALTGAAPIFLDQTRDFNAPEGPVGGQTRVTLRNEHLSYIITWFSLGGATLFMWLKKFAL